MLLYKYRPWNGSTVEVIHDRKIFFPSKRRLNDPAELLHPAKTFFQLVSSSVIVERESADGDPEELVELV